MSYKRRTVSTFRQNNNTTTEDETAPMSRLASLLATAGQEESPENEEGDEPSSLFEHASKNEGGNRRMNRRKTYNPMAHFQQKMAKQTEKEEKDFIDEYDKESGVTKVDVKELDHNTATYFSAVLKVSGNPQAPSTIEATTRKQQEAERAERLAKEEADLKQQQQALAAASAAPKTQWKDARLGALLGNDPTKRDTNYIFFSNEMVQKELKEISQSGQDWERKQQLRQRQLKARRERRHLEAKLKAEEALEAATLHEHNRKSLSKANMEQLNEKFKLEKERLQRELQEAYDAEMSVKLGQEEDDEEDSDDRRAVEEWREHVLRDSSMDEASGISRPQTSASVMSSIADEPLVATPDVTQTGDEEDGEYVKDEAYALHHIPEREALKHDMAIQRVSHLIFDAATGGDKETMTREQWDEVHHALMKVQFFPLPDHEELSELSTLDRRYCITFNVDRESKMIERDAFCNHILFDIADLWCLSPQSHGYCHVLSMIATNIVDNGCIKDVDYIEPIKSWKRRNINEKEYLLPKNVLRRPHARFSAIQQKWSVLTKYFTQSRRLNTAERTEESNVKRGHERRRKHAGKVMALLDPLRGHGYEDAEFYPTPAVRVQRSNAYKPPRKRRVRKRGVQLPRVSDSQELDAPVGEEAGSEAGGASFLEYNTDEATQHKRNADASGQEPAEEEGEEGEQEGEDEEQDSARHMRETMDEEEWRDLLEQLSDDDSGDDELDFMEEMAGPIQAELNEFLEHRSEDVDEEEQKKRDMDMLVARAKTELRVETIQRENAPPPPSDTDEEDGDKKRTETSSSSAPEDEATNQEINDLVDVIKRTQQRKKEKAALKKERAEAARRRKIQKAKDEKRDRAERLERLMNGGRRGSQLPPEQEQEEEDAAESELNSVMAELQALRGSLNGNSSSLELMRQAQAEQRAREARQREAEEAALAQEARAQYLSANNNSGEKANHLPSSAPASTQARPDEEDILQAMRFANGSYIRYEEELTGEGVSQQHQQHQQQQHVGQHGRGSMVMDPSLAKAWGPSAAQDGAQQGQRGSIAMDPTLVQSYAPSQQQTHHQKQASWSNNESQQQQPTTHIQKQTSWSNSKQQQQQQYTYAARGSMGMQMMSESQKEAIAAQYRDVMSNNSNNNSNSATATNGLDINFFGHQAHVHPAAKAQSPRLPQARALNAEERLLVRATQPLDLDPAHFPQGQQDGSASARTSTVKESIMRHAESLGEEAMWSPNHFEMRGALVRGRKKGDSALFESPNMLYVDSVNGPVVWASYQTQGGKFRPDFISATGDPSRLSVSQRRAIASHERQRIVERQQHVLQQVIQELREQFQERVAALQQYVLVAGDHAEHDQVERLRGAIAETQEQLHVYEAQLSVLQRKQARKNNHEGVDDRAEEEEEMNEDEERGGGADGPSGHSQVMVKSRSLAALNKTQGSRLNARAEHRRLRKAHASKSTMDLLADPISVLKKLKNQSISTFESTRGVFRPSTTLGASELEDHLQATGVGSSRIRVESQAHPRIRTVIPTNIKPRQAAFTKISQSQKKESFLPIMEQQDEDDIVIATNEPLSRGDNIEVVEKNVTWESTTDAQTYNNNNNNNKKGGDKGLFHYVRLKNGMDSSKLFGKHVVKRHTLLSSIVSDQVTGGGLVKPKRNYDRSWLDHKQGQKKRESAFQNARDGAAQSAKQRKNSDKGKLQFKGRGRMNFVLRADHSSKRDLGLEQLVKPSRLF